MAVDITLLFKASVKTVKTRNKAIGLGSEGQKDDILKRNRVSSDGFSLKTKDVVSNITKLKDFLLLHRKDYVKMGSLISSDLTHMTDSERDQIDQDAQTFMRTCSDAIKQLRIEAERQAISLQVKEHHCAMLDLVDMYLKGVCKLYSEQRAIRVKRVVDKKRLLRLEPDQQSKAKTSVEPNVPTPLQEENNTDAIDVAPNTEKPVSETPGNISHIWEESRPEDELSPEEIQMFEQENQRLISEMSNVVDEVRQIEGKVVEISRLQEIFSEKVLQQETEIDSIHQLVIGATEHVKEGNEDIREAIKNNAGFRVWILFFLVMCSFSLIFLDWYDG